MELSHRGTHLILSKGFPSLPTPLYHFPGVSVFPLKLQGLTLTLSH